MVLALFLEACLIAPGEIECNVLYAITNQEVLERQVAQLDYDLWLAAYLERHGITADLEPCYQRHRIAESLLMARDLGMMCYTRSYYLKEAKR